MLGGKDLALITVSDDPHIFDVEIPAEELVTVQLRALEEGLSFEDFVRKHILGPNPQRLFLGPFEGPFQARILGWRIRLPEDVRDRLRGCP